MLMGLPGAIYVSGFSAAWIAVGLVIGAYLNYRFVAPRLRIYTEMADDSITIPDFFEKRFHDSSHALRTISALVIIVFFTVYTSSGIVAGGKLFESAFGLNYQLGLFVTAGVVLAYTVVGGFLAVSLTDFVQGVIMLLALVVMPLVVMFGPGGSAGDSLTEIQPGFLSLTQGLTAIGWLSAVTWGLGYFGQPHIIVRFMAIRSIPEVATARNIGLIWMFVCLLGSLGIGLAGRAYADRNGIVVDDPETIFILLADLLFHPLVTGFLLAALLAAIMSTISSQLLVSSSSLTEDFYRLFLRRNASEREAVNVGRVSVLIVALAAIWVASDPESEVLGLVANAWAGFGAAFGPLILLGLTWPRMTGTGALAGLIVGAATVGFWIAQGWNGAFMGGPGVYEIIPGFIAATIATVLVSLATRTEDLDRYAVAAD